MQRIAKFEKVSFQQFLQDMYNTFNLDDAAKTANMNRDEMNLVQKMVYESIKLPIRATEGSAGYDFSSTINFTLLPGSEVLVPTGIRCKIDQGWVLKIYPRSGLGFKYRCILANTVGIIDQDYYSSKNEGHIFIKLVNNGLEKFEVREGERIAQGLFEQYGITYDDDATGIRNGGFGSTDKK